MRTGCIACCSPVTTLRTVACSKTTSRNQQSLCAQEPRVRATPEQRGQHRANPCGEYTKSGLVFDDGTNILTLPYGGQGDLGAYAVLHAGHDIQVSSHGGCSDWFVARASVAVVRGSFEELAN